MIYWVEFRSKSLDWVVSECKLFLLPVVSIFVSLLLQFVVVVVVVVVFESYSGMRLVT